MSTRKEFKIRRQSDGQFSTGGASPRWSDTGKIWKARAHVTNHLHLVMQRNDETYAGTDYDAIDVVEYDICPVESSVSPLLTLTRVVESHTEERQRLAEERQLRAQERRRHLLEEEIATLRKKLGAITLKEEQQAEAADGVTFDTVADVPPAAEPVDETETLQPCGEVDGSDEDSPSSQE